MALIMWTRVASAAPSALPAGRMIIEPVHATRLEKLAGLELQRYIYLRTGTMALIQTSDTLRISGEHPTLTLAVATKGTPLAAQLSQNLTRRQLKAVHQLGPQEYVLDQQSIGHHRVAFIIGGNSIGTLYGAYRYVQHLGISFDLYHDVIPSGRLSHLPPVKWKRGRPKFALRGILPFHDFPEGPDWWNANTYEAVLTQMAKCV
jgi:hypothetical protein